MSTFGLVLERREMSAELLASALQLPEHSIPAALNSLSLTLEANPLEIIVRFLFLLLSELSSWLRIQSLYPALIGIINSSNSIVVVRFLAAQIQSALESVKVTNDMKSAGEFNTSLWPQFQKSNYSNSRGEHLISRLKSAVSKTIGSQEGWNSNTRNTISIPF